jgi:phosphoribosylformylglycinamidine cyclo-ligase
MAVSTLTLGREMKPSAYARAGVDIELGNRVKSGLPKLLASTNRPGVLGKVGGFGGLFALDTRKYRQPVLVSSVDGVGTKLKLAFALDRHDTIGQDLVNHCVNDIAVLGAEPLFFLDYLGTGKLRPHVFQQIIKGFARACAENGCALIGGETAQMPGFYQPGEYDLSGTIVGVVERDRILDGSHIRAGDVVVGLSSSGLHTNGYSLARKILFESLRLKPSSRVAGLRGTIGDELLKVHVSYSPLVRRLLARFNRSSPSQNIIKGVAHITGGGFIDNIPRVLPGHCDAVIRLGSWPVPPLFQLLIRAGKLVEQEQYQVFNMGVGMVLIIAPAGLARVLSFLKTSRQRAWVIGDIQRGSGVTRLA